MASCSAAIVYYNSGYVFEIDSAGYYGLYTSTDKTRTVLTGQTSLYQMNQANQLTVIAMGTTFYFYLNHHFFDQATDKTFGEGQIGLIALDYQQPTTVVYNNLKVWLLP